MDAAKNDVMRTVGIKLLLGMVFAVLGFWVVSLVISMVGSFGEGMGVDAASRRIYSQAHMAVHLFGTASSVAVGLFLSQRHKILATFAIAAIVLCGGYGITNMIGFTTTNRLSVAESKTASNAADWKAYDAKRAAIQGDIDWARKTEVTEENPRERRRILQRIDAKLKELAAVEPPKPTAANVLADPQATWFARLTNSATEKWQLALPVPVAFLLFCAEVFCFVFAMHLLVDGIDHWRSASRGGDRSGSGGSGTGGGSQGGGGDRKTLRGIDGGKEKVATKVAATLHRDAAEVSTEPETSPAALVATSGQQLATSPKVSRTNGQHLPDGLKEDLKNAVEWFLDGGSPWRSARALASEFSVTHRTAGEYVQRAKRLRASQLRTDRRLQGALHGGGWIPGEVMRLAGAVHVSASG